MILQCHISETNNETAKTLSTEEKAKAVKPMTVKENREEKTARLLALQLTSLPCPTHNSRSGFNSTVHLPGHLNDYPY